MDGEKGWALQGQKKSSEKYGGRFLAARRYARFVIFKSILLTSLICQLPEYYDEILNHPNTSDFLRRSTESKLLRHKQQLLFSLPSAITTAPNATVKPEVVEKKKALAKEVEELVEGMVLLKVPDELAWNLVIEGRDVDTIGMYSSIAFRRSKHNYYSENYNFKSLREYIRLFPSSPLTNMIRGYVVYMDLPTLDPEPDEQDEDEEAVELTPIEDQSAAFDIMLVRSPRISLDGVWSNANSLRKHSQACNRPS